MSDHGGHGGHESHGGTHEAHGGGFWVESGTYALNPFKVIADSFTILTPGEVKKPIESASEKVAESGMDVIQGATGAVLPGGGGGGHGGGHGHGDHGHGGHH